MKKLRVGIIGLGVGERHISGFRRNSNAEVVALCDCEADVRDRIKRSYPNMQVSSDAETLLDDPSIDIVSIASYDNDHFAQVTHALENGKHVFVEKPLCLRPEEWHVIRNMLATRPQLRLSSNLILRVSPRFQELRSSVAAGDLGRIFNIEGDYLYGRLDKLTSGWRGRIPHYSVILGGAIHLIDLLMWLTGDRVKSVFAIGNGISSEGSAFSGNDMVSALLTFNSGMTGKISANFGSVYPHFHKLVLYGTKGTFENSREDALLWKSRDPTVNPARIASAYPGVDKGDLIPSFVDAVLGTGPALVTEDEVLAAMAVGLAIDQSLSEKQVVTVADI
jgi:predicted dehydrogenase